MPWKTIQEVIEAGKEFIKNRVKEGEDPEEALRIFMDLMMQVAVRGDISAFKQIRQKLYDWILNGMKEE